MADLTPTAVKGATQWAAFGARLHNDVFDSKDGGTYLHNSERWSATESDEWASWMMYVIQQFDGIDSIATARLTGRGTAGTGAPEAIALSSDYGVGFTFTAGSLKINTPQDLQTSATPQFANLFVGAASLGAAGASVIAVKNGTAPAIVADEFQLYSSGGHPKCASGGASGVANICLHYGNLGAAPTGIAPGAMYRNSGDSKTYVTYDGTNWEALN